MKTQNGSYRIKSGSWVFRYRETVREGGQTKRVMRSKIIRVISAEDRRSGLYTRKAGKKLLHVPADVTAIAAGIIEPLQLNPASVAVTIGDFVADYLKEREKDLKPWVHYNYTRLWEKHLEHRIARKTLREYKRPDCFVLWKEILRDNPHFSRQTMSHIRFFLSGVFNAAKNHGPYVGENPASADLPPGLRGRSETHAYTAEQVVQMLSLLAGNLQGQALIALGFGGGLGAAELAGVRWEDYEKTDIGAKVHVNQNVYRGKIGTPKTEARKNVSKIGPEVCAFIDAYRESIGDPKDGLMFCYSPKRPINLQSFAKWTLKPLFTAAGIPWAVKGDKGWGWHALRRGNATHLAQHLGGDGTRAASLMLRHSDQGVTEDHYILNSNQERRALKAYQKLEDDRTRDGAAEAIGQALRPRVH